VGLLQALELDDRVYERKKGRMNKMDVKRNSTGGEKV
jgi:hypothetical protein